MKIRTPPPEKLDSRLGLVAVVLILAGFALSVPGPASAVEPDEAVECGMSATAQVPISDLTIDSTGTFNAVLIFAKFPDGEDVRNDGTPWADCTGCGPGWDASSTSPPVWAHQLIDSTATPAVGSLSHYLDTWSKGSHTLTGTVLDTVIVVDSTVVYYDTTYTATRYEAAYQATLNVLEQADALFDFSTVDDGDGIVDYVFVLFRSGRHFRDSDSTYFSMNRLWTAVSNLFPNVQSSFTTNDGVTIAAEGGSILFPVLATLSGTVHVVREPWTVMALMAHEYGHDLVSLAERDQGGGHFPSASRYSVMHGTIPTGLMMHPYFRHRLGWISPPVIHATGAPFDTTVVLSASYLDHEASLLIVEPDPTLDPDSDQYFILEAKRDSLASEIYNRQWPDSASCCWKTLANGRGLLVSHVADSSKYIGTFPNSASQNPPLFDIEVATGAFDPATGAPDPAMGLNNLRKVGNVGLGGFTGRREDFFIPHAPGTKRASNLMTPYTNPSTNLYNETTDPSLPKPAQTTYSGISFYNVAWTSGAQESLTVSIRFDGISPPAADTVFVDTTWDGLVQLSGDVVVRPEATLTIGEDALIVSAASDRHSGGVDTLRNEISVQGRMTFPGPDSAAVLTSSRDDAFFHWLPVAGSADTFQYPGETTPAAAADWYGPRIAADSLAPGPAEVRYSRAGFAFESSTWPPLTQLDSLVTFVSTSCDVIFDRDLLIPEDSTGTVPAGLTLGFRRGDAGSSGDSTGLVELIVQGRLIAEGAPSDSVVLKSAELNPSPEDWYGLRFDISGSVAPGYGYVGSLQDHSSLSTARISDAEVGIQVENIIPPRLSDIVIDNVSTAGGVARHVYLDSADVVIPYGVWNADTTVLTPSPGLWDLDGPLNIVATNGAKAALESAYGETGLVDLLVEGILMTDGSAGNPVLFRPETRNDLTATDWGGLYLENYFKGVLRWADIGHAANPVFSHYPDSSSGLVNSTIHHFADIGLWVRGSSGVGGVFDSLLVDRSSVGFAIGNRGVLFDKVGNGHLSAAVNLDDPLMTGLGEGYGIKVYQGKTYCLAGPPSTDLVEVSDCVVTGNGEASVPGSRYGIFADWVCSPVNVEGNVVRHFNAAGARLSQAVGTTLKCNNIYENLRAALVDRNSEPLGTSVKFKTNYLAVSPDSIAPGAVAVVESDNALKTDLGPSSLHKGDNHLFASDAWAVLENDPDSADVLEAANNFWYRDHVLKTSAVAIDSLISSDDTTAVPNVDISGYYTVALLTDPPCIPGTGGTGTAANPAPEQKAPDAALADDLPEAVSQLERVPGPVPAATQLLEAFPNPTPGGVALEFSVGTDSRGRVNLAVYGVSGRRVRVLVSDPLPPGRYRAYWNGRDGGGSRASSGVYFVSLRTSAGRDTHRIVVLER